MVEGAVTDSGTVTLQPSGRVRGRVLDADGNAVNMALVTCRKVGDDGPGERQPALGGAFKVDSLAPGTYVLSAQALGVGGRGENGPEVRTEVTSGKTATVELRLPRQ